MLRNMFIGSPEGNYDRLLDFSTAVTGGLFFVPSQPLLERLGDGPLDATSTEPATTGAAGLAPGGGRGSLEIGSLRGASPDE
jgi:putative iron-dependent peroxidase